MLAFKIYPFVQALIILLFFVWPLRITIKKKLILSLILGIGSLKLYLFYLTGGTIMDPSIGRVTTIIVNAWYFTTIFVAVFTLLRMIVNGIYKLSRLSFSKYVIPPASLRYALVNLSVSVILGFTGVLNGFSSPDIKNYEIKLSSLNPDDNGFVIVQLSDLHVSLPSTIEEMEDIVNTVNKINADLVVITGDFVDGDIKTLDEKISPVFKLKSKHGIYAVSGNHEFYSGYEQWISYLEKGGIRFLENTSTIITTKDGRGILNLCGLIDPTGQNYGFDKPEILNAVKDIDPDLPVVFLSHQPKLADDLKKVSDLTLSGHTHGGLMPILKSIVKSANKGYVSGLYKIENQWLIVNNGTRIWAGIPLRIATPAEISVIKLSQK